MAARAYWSRITLGNMTRKQGVHIPPETGPSFSPTHRPKSRLYNIKIPLAITLGILYWDLLLWRRVGRSSIECPFLLFLIPATLVFPPFPFPPISIFHFFSIYIKYILILLFHVQIVGEIWVPVCFPSLFRRRFR